jgi:hypothetical protein
MLSYFFSKPVNFFFFLQFLKKLTHWPQRDEIYFASVPQGNWGGEGGVGAIGITIEKKTSGARLVALCQAPADT